MKDDMLKVIRKTEEVENIPDLGTLKEIIETKEKLEREIIELKRQLQKKTAMLNELRSEEAQVKVAQNIRKVFESYKAQGFTEEQSWDILKLNLCANSRRAGRE